MNDVQDVQGKAWAYKLVRPTEYKLNNSKENWY